jgi:hypothetical protein
VLLVEDLSSTTGNKCLFIGDYIFIGTDKYIQITFVVSKPMITRLGPGSNEHMAIRFDFDRLHIFIGLVT